MWVGTGSQYVTFAEFLDVRIYFNDTVSALPTSFQASPFHWLQTPPCEYLEMLEN